jgi:signal peptidase I
VGKHFVTVASLVLVTGLGVRLVFLQGLFRPVRIAGGSMAETMLGPHFVLDCQDCGFAIRYDADHAPSGDRVVCPNCGRTNSGLARAARQAGHRVLLDRLAYRWRPPKRWEVVAFRTPGEEDFFAVKRVVGLPLENVAIRHGDLYVDGRIERKTLDQMRAAAILVHDNRYRPTPDEDLPPRWRPESTASGWQLSSDPIRFESDVRRRARNGSAEVDWLVYHHRRCVDSPAPRSEEYAVLDNYGYNQEVSRQLHQVTDLLLVCRGQFDARNGVFALQVHDGRECFEVQIAFRARHVSLHCGRRCLAVAPLPRAAYARDVTFELALCDQQAVFAIDRRVVLHHCYDVAGAPRAPTPCPLRIGAAEVSATIRRLQVFRDLYYMGPDRMGWDWSAREPLGDDALFVIGDNVPVSRDSRHGSPSRVTRRRLLGRVLQGN